MNFYGSSAVYGSASSAISFANMFSVRNYNYDNNLKFLSAALLADARQRVHDPRAARALRP